MNSLMAYQNFWYSMSRWCNGQTDAVEQPVVSHRHVDPTQIIARAEKQRFGRCATHHPSPVAEDEQPIDVVEIVFSRILIQKQFQGVAESFVPLAARLPQPVRGRCEYRRA